jgi:catechol 2,3-dioxygenase
MEVLVTSPQHPAATRPPRYDIAHVGHVELLSPEPEASLRFFVDVLGLTENGREGNSVYLRTWDDYEHHTVKLTAHDTSGIRRVGLRTSSQAALEACVAAVEAAGLGIGWKDGDPGIGHCYLCRDPDGHEIELYWESEWYTPPAALRPALKNQAQAYPGRGVCVRRLDHVNYLAREAEPNGDFVCDVLGGRVTEQIMMDNGSIAAQWLHFTNKGYDLVYTRDWTGSTGRLHHVAFTPDNREDILRAADICLDAGIFIETGPHKHAIQQTFFLYVYEPGGNRIELCHPGARLVLAPDWRTVTWTEAERAKGQAWGLKTIESFHTHGTPPVGLCAVRGRRPARRCPGRRPSWRRRRSAADPGR